MQARVKLHQAEYTSDLTDTEDCLIKRKARSKLFQSQCKQLESSEQSDSEEELPPTPPEKTWASTPTVQQVASPTVQQVTRPTAQRVPGSTVQQVTSPTAQRVPGSTVQQVTSPTAQQVASSTVQRVQDASMMEVPDGVVFPLKTQADVEALEEKLGDRSLMSAVVAMVADIGGTSVDDATRQLMKYILSNELALDYNMFGCHRKKRFKDLRLFSVVYEAFKKNSLTAQVN